MEPQEIPILQALSPFQGVPPEHLVEVLPRLAWRDLDPGGVLLRPGAVNTNLFIIVSGRLQVLLDGVDDGPLVFLGPGEYVGEMSAVASQPVTALVVADGPARVLVVDEMSLWTLIQRSPQLVRNLLCTLSRRLRHSNELITTAYMRRRDSDHLAQRDPLTGLLNRRGLEADLHQLVAHSHAEGLPLTLLVLDVDDFKSFNDHHGHTAGDQILVAVALAVSESLRPGDLAGRFGGDELVVGLARTTAPKGRRVAKRIRETIAAIHLESEAGERLPTPTVSIGLAQLEPGQSAGALFMAADARLLQAKADGRDRLAG